LKTIVNTNKGKRETNQDCVLVQNIGPNTFLLLVVDGMGGYEHGEEVAKLVAENIQTYLSTIKEFDSNQIQKSVNKANLAVRQFKERENSKCGATVAGIILSPHEALCFWVGDVKVFHFREGTLQAESRSHTLMNDVIENSQLTDAKQISKFKHIVTRSIQGDIELSQVDYFKVVAINDKDMFMICSDGVHDIFDGTRIQHALSTFSTADEAMNNICEQLKIEAEDNFSLICASPSL